MCDFSETTIDVRDDSLNSSCKDAAEKIVALRQSVVSEKSHILCFSQNKFAKP